MPELPSRKLIESLIDHERLLVVPQAPSPDTSQKIVQLAKGFGLALEREKHVHRAQHAHAISGRHGGGFRVQQDLRVSFDDCELEPDGTLVLKQELRFRPGAAKHHAGHPNGPLTQTDGQIWLKGSAATKNAALLKQALEKAGIPVAISYAYSLPKQPLSDQRYAVDPWHVEVKFDDTCDAPELRKRLGDLLKIDSGSGPWFSARVLAPGDPYDLAVKFYDRVKDQARLALRSIPLVLPVAHAPPDPEYATIQKPALDLIAAEAMWDSVLAWTGGGHALGKVNVFVIDTGVFPGADVSVDPALSVLIDCPTSPTSYLPGCLPLGDDPHGTQMAGIVGAAWNSFRMAGLIGIASTSVIKMVALRCLSLTHIRKALEYAGNNVPADTRGVVVIGLDLLQLYYNAAWCPAFAGEATVFSDALTTATTTKNLLVVVPSGNYNPLDPLADPLIGLPTPSNLTGTVIVGACNTPGNARWNDPTFPGGTRYGDDLSLLAPGAGVYSTTGAGSYGTDSGTSFAAAHVAGVAALMRSINPNLPASAVKTRLVNASTTAGVTPAPPNPQVGKGRLNGQAAVDAAKLPYP